MNATSIKRRSFLGAASAALLAPAPASSEPLNRNIRTFLAEGILDPDTSIGKQPLSLPPDLVAALAAGAQIRARVQYIDRRNLLDFHVFLAAPGAPAPPSQAPADNDPRLFAHMLFDIRDSQLSTFPELSLGLYGRVLTEIKPSPFFPGLTGRLVGIQLGFQQEGDTPVSMLAVAVAGDHVIVARRGRGHIELRP